MEVNAFSLVPGSLGPQAKESGCVLLLLSHGRTKGGLPSGGRKGGARSAANFLSPSTELEKFLTTSVEPTAEHNVAGLCSDAEGCRSRYSTSIGRLGSAVASGRKSDRWRPERAGDFFAELSLALGYKESDVARWKKSPMPRNRGMGDCEKPNTKHRRHEQYPTAKSESVRSQAVPLRCPTTEKAEARLPQNARHPHRPPDEPRHARQQKSEPAT